MATVRRALFLSFAERYLSLALAVGSSMVIARLLVPEQIGVFSVSMAVISVAQALRDFGVGNYLIQERNLGEAEIGTAFGVSLLMGSVLFGVTAFGAPYAAAYYAESRMEATLRIASLNFLLLPFCTVSLSLLRREMQFRRLLYVTLAAGIANAVTSVALAAMGFGENSLAWGSVASNAVMGIGAWMARPDRRWIRPGFAAWRRVLNFGGQNAAAGLVTSVSMDANDLIVGKLLGFDPVAMLSRAQGLMNIFHRDLMSAVRNVALPSLAQAHRDHVPLGPPFLKSVALLTSFAWPFYGLVSIYALEIIDLLYGAQWRAAAPLVPIFCLSGALAAVNILTPNLLVATGRIDLVTKVELVMQPLRVLLIAVAAWATQSLVACALAYLLSSALALPVNWWCKRQSVPDDRRLIRQYLWANARVTIAVLIVPLGHALVHGLSRTEPLPPWQWLPMSALGVLAGVWVVSRIDHPLREEAGFRRLLGWARVWR